MYQYYVGIDVAKNKCDFTIFKVNDQSYSEVRTISNSITGCNELINSISELPKSKTLFALESTAHYHRLFSDTLSNRGYNTCIFNPLLTNKVHSSNIRKTKNDKIDAVIIANLALLNPST